MREKKQADWEERRKVRIEKEKKELGKEGSPEKLAGEGFSKRVEEDEESSSEDEGWCAGVPAFKGTPSVVIAESNEAAVKDSLISDDEDNENIEKKGDDLEAVIEGKGRGDDNIKKGLLCKQVLNSGEKLQKEAVGYSTNEVLLEKQDPVEEEVLEEGLDQAVQGDDNESDVEDVKSDLEGSSDEAPEEIKIVKCYENEDPCDADTQSRSKTPDCDEKSKPSRKRKRKAKKSSAANESEAVVAHKEETGSSGVSAKKEKAAEPKEKIAKVTRQSVLEQRIRPPTLLERLLLQEIKKERNTILQCVRYVCKNNFFEANKSS